MKNIDFPMLFLAILVVIMFSLVGITISYGNIWLILLFLFLGFALMAYGIRLKKMSSK